MKTPEILNKAGQFITDELQKLLRLRGHSNTGALENSITNEVMDTELTGTMFDYGFIVDKGTSADRIPYGGRTGSGGTSKYIEGLIAYFKSKGLEEKEAKQAAFATANVQKREGMSTKASTVYSQDGTRQSFVKDTFEQNQSKIDKMIEDGMNDIFNEAFNQQKSETI